MNQTLVIASIFLAIFQYIIFFIDVAKVRGYVESISSLVILLFYYNRIFKIATTLKYHLRILDHS